MPESGVVPGDASAVAGRSVQDPADPQADDFAPTAPAVPTQERRGAHDAPPALLAAPPEEDEPVEAVEEGAPAWMMTFGDMMSLLLTFFILLFSMSTIEVEKFRAATESLSDALGQSSAGVLPGGATPSPASSGVDNRSRDEIVDRQMDEIAEQLEQFVREHRLEDQVVVSKESHGVFLRMQNQALFGPGSADIAEASVTIVEQLGSVLDRMDLPVKVSGHTDNVPIGSSAFPSNWELSAARAAGVARILVSRGHDPAAVAVEAFGEHRPVAGNDTPEGRAQNRRVELYFARTAVESALESRGMLPRGEESGTPPSEGSPTPSPDA